MEIFIQWMLFTICITLRLNLDRRNFQRIFLFLRRSNFSIFYEYRHLSNENESDGNLGKRNVPMSENDIAFPVPIWKQTHAQIHFRWLEISTQANWRYPLLASRFSLLLIFHERASSRCRWHTSVQFEVENRWCNVTAPIKNRVSLSRARINPTFVDFEVVITRLTAIRSKFSLFSQKSENRKLCKNHRKMFDFFSKHIQNRNSANTLVIRE